MGGIQMRILSSRVFGLVTVSLFLAWLVGIRGYADYLAGPAPERALALNSTQPEALLAKAELALVARRYADAERLASLALRAAPMSGPALRVLGAVAEVHGDSHKAMALIEQAVATTPRDTAGQFWLAINALANRDLPGCLQRLDRLLRIEPEVARDAFPVLATIAVSPAGVADMAKVLAPDPPWRAGFMSDLIAQAPSVIDVLRLFRGITAAGGSVMALESDRLAARMSAAGDWRRLRKLIAETAGSVAASELIHDGAFDGRGRGPLLGWDIGRVSGADALIGDDPQRAGNRVLHLAFYGRRVPFRHVSQLLLLRPGRYQLSGRVRLSGLETSQGLVWTVSCARGATRLGNSEKLRGSSEWRSFSIQFEVPATDDCGGQDLRLLLDARIAAEQQVVGEAWFDDFTLDSAAVEDHLRSGKTGTLETVLGSR